MYKTFTSQYGNDASDYHIPVVKSIEENSTTGNITGEFYYLAYDSVARFNSGFNSVDCFRPMLKYSVTQAEVELETGTFIQRLEKSFVKKSTESIIIDGIETNLFYGVIGTISYIGGSY